MNEIIEKCIKQLNSINLQASIEVELGNRFDFLLTINPEFPLVMIGEVKNRVESRARAMDVAAQLKRIGDRAGELMLFCDWISPSAAAEMRSQGVNYVDACGNIFIRVPPYILINVQDPKMLTAPLREMARRSNVSLGTAHIVVAELEKKGWLLPRKDGRKIGDWDSLFDTFVKGYGLKLRPSLVLGKYRHFLRNPDELVESLARRLNGAGSKWALAGGIASKQRMLYLEPDEVSLFVDEVGFAALRQEKMSSDETEGNLTLFRLYSESLIDEASPSFSSRPVTTMFLVYAELIHDGRPRELETAKMIYEQVIKRGQILDDLIKAVLEDVVRVSIANAAVPVVVGASSMRNSL